MFIENKEIIKSTNGEMDFSEEFEKFNNVKVHEKLDLFQKYQMYIQIKL